MRNETRAKLDRMLRARRYTQLAVAAAVLTVVAVFIAFAQPGGFVREVEASVTRSSIVSGSYTGSSAYHSLYAKLPTGQVVRVNTFINRQLEHGTPIKLRHYETWIGYQDYRWEPR